ncbi:protein ZNRD2 [Ammospiza caudacuta]|uniref:protein ZNRD2 n=1 Tax=Ammospiza caudacuta TaxID=2857398 RepID=UPI0027392AF0|nr:protein ZNRD2 [Ammospiza caudacuta]
MGALLLRGYRMLGSSCPECGTVLLQDKEQRLLCVSCQEPEQGPAAAPGPPRPERCEGRGRRDPGLPPPGPGAPRCRCRYRSRCDGATGAAVAAARAALLQKLLWAARELPRSRLRGGQAPASAAWCGTAPSPSGGCATWSPPGAPRDRLRPCEPPGTE